MNKLSGAQVNEILKTSAASLRAQSEEIQQLTAKVSQYEKRAQAESIAVLMEEKGLNTGLSHEEKVASIMERKDIPVLEEAVKMSTPQMKLASVDDDDAVVPVEGDVEGNSAADTFAANIIALD